MIYMQVCVYIYIYKCVYIYIYISWIQTNSCETLRTAGLSGVPRSFPSMAQRRSCSRIQL